MSFTVNDSQVNRVATRFTAVTGAVVIDASAGSYFEILAGAGNVTLTLVGFRPGQPVNLSFQQDGVGGRTLTATGGGAPEQAPIFSGASASYTPDAAASRRTFYTLIGNSTGSSVNVFKLAP